MPPSNELEPVGVATAKVEAAVVQRAPLAMLCGPFVPHPIDARGGTMPCHPRDRGRDVNPMESLIKG
eukprot:CAMPEP_0174723678 /NCGR_PEP_ID=MMETSP1094-20130205/41598_1 /TAXON_ID=156173 /ORGANISM="Chrysochromulina brevifilum, Strain UTEX LB 985" /LENGTH=66 /DNA_ID=CAMNT_0015924763 /DNA_START=171 /DNA_END=371 /DNA_ORIENTATION=-